MYIAIEGIDTAGKSTQIERLKSIFPEAVFTKEPGGTSIGIEIRSMVLHGSMNSKMGELFLFLADRSEHTSEIILPNMKKMIISDRSLVSGMAYASVQQVCKRDDLIQLNRLATQDHFPDMVFILKLTPEVLTYRLGLKEHDVIESRGADYLLSIQDALIDSSNALNITTHVIDATQSIESITNEITTLIKGTL